MSRVDELRALREKQHAKIMASRGSEEAQEEALPAPVEKAPAEEASKPKGRTWPAKGSRKIASRKNK